MCLLIFAHQADPRYPLVVAGNRDEFHARPTAASGFWPEYPELLAGKDLQQGGTWMGVTRSGRFAAITNYRDPARTSPAPRSRGELPLNYLKGELGPQAYLQGLLTEVDEYAGFNLLVGTMNSLWYLTNSPSLNPPAPQCLAPGIYGLSNAMLDTPWPKVLLGKRRLEPLLGGEPLNHNALAEVVSSRTLAEPAELQQQGLIQGMDQILSAQFITTGSYGTRSGTSLWMERDGDIHWKESIFDPEGGVLEQREESFKVEHRTGSTSV